MGLPSTRLARRVERRRQPWSIWGNTVSSSSKHPVVTIGALAISVAAIAGCASAPDDPDAVATTTSASPTAGSAASATEESEAAPATTEPTFVATDTAVPTDGSALAVVLTGAEWNPATDVVEANGFVSGVVEDGGTCTLTLEKGGDTATTSNPGEPDAATTNCGLLEVGGDLDSGTWTAVLSYRSDAGRGTSSTLEVDVP